MISILLIHLGYDYLFSAHFLGFECLAEFAHVESVGVDRTYQFFYVYGIHGFMFTIRMTPKVF